MPEIFNKFFFNISFLEKVNAEQKIIDLEQKLEILKEVLSTAIGNREQL
jgi:hypothetical protein